MRAVPLIGLVAVLALAGCGGGGGTRSTTDANGCVVMTAPKAGARSEKAPTTPLDAAKTYDGVIRTNCGSFTIRLDPKQSPHATSSFVALANAGYFDGTIFHRIVPGFVIQGGDPTATGTGGPGYSTVDKPPSNASY